MGGKHRSQADEQNNGVFLSSAGQPEGWCRGGVRDDQRALDKGQSNSVRSRCHSLLARDKKKTSVRWGGGAAQVDRKQKRAAITRATTTKATATTRSWFRTRAVGLSTDSRCTSVFDGERGPRALARAQQSLPGWIAAEPSRAWDQHDTFRPQI